MDERGYRSIERCYRIAFKAAIPEQGAASQGSGYLPWDMQPWMIPPSVSKDSVGCRKLPLLFSKGVYLPTLLSPRLTVLQILAITGAEESQYVLDS